MRRRGFQGVISGRGAIGWLLLTALVGGWPAGTLAQSLTVTCHNFPNQAAAQAAFRANPTGLSHLDRDRDGIACESLPCPCENAPTRPQTTGSSSASATVTVPPAFIFTAPTIPPAPPTAVPSAARASVGPSAGPRVGPPPVWVAGLSGALAAAPPREASVGSEAPPPAAPEPVAPEAGFAELADTWSGRAGVLAIHADGRAQALWPVGGGTGLDGRAALALQWRDGASVVAQVESSSHEPSFPLGVVILRLRPDGVLELWPAAGEDAPRTYCNDRLWQQNPGLAQDACARPAP